jgi:hypothetical protein
MSPQLNTTIARLLLMLVFFLSLSSCKKEPTAPYHYYADPGSYKHGTFPLATGNQWAYIDSNYTITVPSNPFVRIRIASIVSYNEFDNEPTWKYTDINGQPNISYTISNDTVYVNDSPDNGALLNPRIAFLPPTAIHDTVRIIGPYSWSTTKIYSLGHTFTTPAGAFDSVYVYEVGNNGVTLTYFRPEIGVLCTAWRSGDGSYLSTSTLVSYVIAK